VGSLRTGSPGRRRRGKAKVQPDRLPQTVDALGCRVLPTLWLQVRQLETRVRSLSRQSDHEAGTNGVKAGGVVVNQGVDRCW
jgi:hypothetical protein